MANRIIAKRCPPRISDAIPRARLFARLDGALRRPIVFVHGPPGAGKTTLIASYLRARALPAAWYHMDIDDADPATFFLFLGQLVQGRSRRRTGLPLLTPEYLPDLENFSRRYFRALFARLPDRAVLVFDNTHSVGAGSAFHSIITTAVQEVPEGAGIIWIGRIGPVPAHSRLFANDSAWEIDNDELLLTREETQALVTRKFGLASEAAEPLFRQTQGWAAGIVLLAQHWKRLIRFPDSGDRITLESIEHYFASEIVGKLTADESRTLMHTALLPAVTREMAVELSGDPRAGEIMDKLLRRGLFVQRQAGAAPRYRYHDLFREYLFSSLRGSLSPGAWGEALLCAANVALRNGDLESALPLLCEAQELDRAAVIVRENARTLLQTGRFQTLLVWIDRIGPDVLERDAWIRLWQGRALMMTDLGAARAALSSAYAQFVAGRDHAGALVAATQMIYAYYYAYTDYAPMAQWVARIDTLLAAGAEAPDLESDAELRTALVFAATWLGDVDEGLFIDRAEQLLRDPAVGPGLRVSLGYALADYYTIGSRMADAQRAIDRFMPLVNDSACTPLVRVYAYLQTGYNRMRAGEPEEARRNWQIADDIAREHGLRQTEFVSRLFASFLCSSEGDAAGAEVHMRGLDSQVGDDQPLSGALYHIAGVLMEMAREDGPAAARHAKLSLDHARRLGGGFMNVAWRAHGSAALALAGEHKEAERWIEEGLRQAQGTWLECYRTNLLMSRAYSLLLQGKRDAAKPVIAEMLRLARDNGWWTYLRLLTRVKDIVLREAVADRIELPIARLLVRNLRALPGDDPPRDWPWQIRVYTMGVFRVELNGKPLTFSRKAQKRPLDLLRALIALGGQGVGMALLSEMLWTESEADAAGNALTMAIHRLRRLLDEEGAIVVREGKCSLDPGIVWVDAWELGRTLDANQDAEASSDVEAILTLYRGHFLERDEEWPWVLPMRQRLRVRFRRACILAGRRLEQSGRLDEAVHVYERGIELDSLAEDLYQQLIQCHRARGRTADAAETYRRCRQMLSVMLGTHPSPGLQALFRELQRD